MASRAAPPRGWEVPDPFDARGRPLLYAAPEVVITWETRTTEVAYTFTSRDGRLLATGHEPDLSAARRAGRVLIGPGRARIRLVCRTEDGAPVFTLAKRAAYFGLHPTAVMVRSPRDEILGSVALGGADPARSGYLLRDADGHDLARVSRPSGKTRTHVVVDPSGTEVARLTDPLDVGMSDKHALVRLIVQFRSPPAEPLHTLLLAAVPGINFLSGEHIGGDA